MTPEREQRFRRTIAQRQSDLTVVLEEVADPHNIMAILRSCDAVGIKEVYAIRPLRRESRKKDVASDFFGKRSSAGARKWVDLNIYEDTHACVDEVRSKYGSLWATYLGGASQNLYDMDLTQPMALVFGNERKGISPELVELCDGNFRIPMVGMIRSLNISVACATAVYEAYRQRRAAGTLTDSALSEAEQHELYQRWHDRDQERFQLRKERRREFRGR